MTPVELAERLGAPARREPRAGTGWLLAATFEWHAQGTDGGSAARSASSLRAKRALGRAKRAPTRAKRALSTREARSSTHEAPTHAQIALRHTCSALLPINTEHSTQRLRAVKR